MKTVSEVVQIHKGLADEEPKVGSGKGRVARPRAFCKRRAKSESGTRWAGRYWNMGRDSPPVVQQKQRQQQAVDGHP